MVFQNRPECVVRTFKLDRRVCGVTVKQRAKQKAGQPCVSTNRMCLPAHWIHSSQCAHSILPLTVDVSQQRWGYRCVPHLALRCVPPALLQNGVIPQSVPPYQCQQQPHVLSVLQCFILLVLCACAQGHLLEQGLPLMGYVPEEN